MALTVFAPAGYNNFLQLLAQRIMQIRQLCGGERKKVELLLVLFLCLSDPQLAPLFQFAKQRQRIVGSGK